MICTECSTAYSDEFMYCLSDGAPLIDDNAETPTVVRSDRAFTGLEVICPSCALPGPADSRFCKRCGYSLPSAQAEVPVAATIPIIQPPAPPTAFESPPTSTARTNPTPFILIAVGGVLLAIVAAVVAYNLGVGTTAANSSAAVNTLNANKTSVNNAASASRTASPAPSATNSAADPVVGKAGTLTTDVNLRDSPDRNSQKVGTQYQGARIRILATAEAPNDEGTLSTWYRIQVTSYGTSLNPNNYGQSKDPDSADEGWINSNPKVYDQTQKKQVHKRTVDFGDNN